ncbi:MAG: hypothetical protein HQL11_01490, partial [Candidatus Omnitrophica bacterium]|nr:hypothetical protein [Candidatus Omnitrophota bacterium]
MKKGYVFQRGLRWFVALPDPQYASGYRIKSPSYGTEAQARRALKDRAHDVEASQLGRLKEGNTYYSDFVR